MMTYIEAINRVLQKCGENIVSSHLSNPTAQLAGQVINDTIVNLSNENVNWPWLERAMNADSWVNDKAIIDDDIIHVHRIIHSEYGSKIEYVPQGHYESAYAPHNYSYSAGCPSVYSIFGKDFYFHPYPDNEDERNKIVFFVSALPSELSADTDQLNWGRQYEMLLIHRASASFAIEHLGDGARAGQFASEYERLLTQLKHRFTDVKDTRRSMIF